MSLNLGVFGKVRLTFVFLKEADIRDPESIRKAVQHSNLVINCIGTNYETRNFSFNDVNVEGPRLIAKIARECGVEKLIHFSSLNASPQPQKIFQESRFLKTKYEGELAVREEFDDAVIIRPANIIGESDKFLFYYANEYRRGFKHIPLWRKGEMTIKMPVHVTKKRLNHIDILFYDINESNAKII